MIQICYFLPFGSWSKIVLFSSIDVYSIEIIIETNQVIFNTSLKQCFLQSPNFLRLSIYLIRIWVFKEILDFFVQKTLHLSLKD